MTDSVIAFVSSYGAWVLWVGTFLSCLAMPIPSSFLMLAGGAFVASGDLSFHVTVLAAFSGAVIGDQVGYWLGLKGGQLMSGWLHKNQTRTDLMAKAQVSLRKRGMASVYLTRWLFSPLGPYVNFLAGIGTMQWSRFTLASIAGEITWVSIYVGLGMAFSNSITLIAEMAGDIVGLLAAGLVAFLAGKYLLKKAQTNPGGRD